MSMGVSAVKIMRLVATGSLVVSLVGVAGAQSGDGLGRTLDRQQQDLQRQQSEWRREIEAQGRALQQQQDQTLRQHLTGSSVSSLRSTDR